MSEGCALLLVINGRGSVKGGGQELGLAKDFELMQLLG